MKTILLTGATGFIGTNLTRFWAGAGIEVVALTRAGVPVEGVSRACAWTQLANVDGAHFDAIIHLAGKAHDVRGTSADSEYLEANVALAEELARHALDTGFVGKFVYFSSVKAVADVVVGELDEAAPARPATAYGRSKLQGEKRLAQLFADRLENLFILRPCMVHGSGNKGNLNLLHRFVAGRLPYPLAAFANQRSLLGIGNLCHIVDQIVRGAVPGGTYHLADSGTISTAEIVSLMAEQSGSPISRWRVPRWVIRLTARAGDYLPLPLNSDRLQKLTTSYVVSNAKILDQLGAPLPFSLREGLAETIKSL